MRNKSKPWWSPSELIASEEQIRKSKYADKLDPNNDFGSYHLLLSGRDITKSGLAHHNDLNPKPKIILLKNSLSLHNAKTILDLGCGAGYTTYELSRVFKGARVTGVDISSDAVTWGKKFFPGLDLRVEIVDPERPAFGRYDLIFAFEFYYFSRSKDPIFLSKVIDYLMQMVAASGSLIIYQKWNTPDSLSDVFFEVVELCRPQYDLTIKLLAHPKLPFFIPERLRFFISFCLNLISKQGLKHVVLVRHRMKN